MRELRQLTPKLKELCRRLAGLGLPATLVHGDLHIGNVARRDGLLTFFDIVGAESQRPDDQGQCQPLTDQRHQDDAEGEEDDQVARGEVAGGNTDRQRQRRCKGDNAAQSDP